MVKVSYLDTADFTLAVYREILERLSAERRARAERYLSQGAAFLSAGASYLLERALRRAGRAERNERYTFGERGKPCLEGFSFSLSHSGTLAVLATAEGEVGIDLQKIVSVKGGLTERVCTERESGFLAALAPEERERAFFRLWTAKESAGKYFGTGLPDPKEFEIDLEKSSVLRRKEETGLALREYPLEGYSLTACAREAFSPRAERVIYGRDGE